MDAMCIGFQAVVMADRNVKREIVKMQRSWFSENIMGSNSSEKIGVSVDLKSNAVSGTNPRFPNGLVAFHLFKLKRRMMRVIEKGCKLLVNLSLNVAGKGFIGTFERLGKDGLHFLRSLRRSADVVYGPETSPLAISPSTSFSFSCHSFVQNHSWSLGTSLWGIRTMELSF